ncbi:hypothetical protein ACFX19_023442 [Malus domestica]
MSSKPGKRAWVSLEKAHRSWVWELPEKLDDATIIIVVSNWKISQSSSRILKNLDGEQFSTSRRSITQRFIWNLKNSDKILDWDNLGCRQGRWFSPNNTTSSCQWWRSSSIEGTTGERRRFS